METGDPAGMPIFVGDALVAHAQGGCFRCHRGDSLVDMDAFVEAEGALALCVGCIGEAAEAAGMHLNGAAVAEKEAAFVEERRRFCPERVEELEAQLHETRQALEVSQRVEAQLQAALVKATK